MVKMNKCWFDKLEKLYIENVKVTIKDGVVTIKPYPEKDMERCYRELEEENKRLSYKLKEKICFEGHQQFKELQENSIPISVIQNKIDELKMKGEKENFYISFWVIQSKIRVLQKLLEERNK